jgi:hypothetical protein
MPRPDVLVERAAHPRDRALRAVLAPHDELRDHRIVVDRDLRALVAAAVVADVRPVGDAQVRDRARRRAGTSPDPRRRPALDGVAAPARVELVLRQRQRSPSATSSCHATRSTPVDQLGHRVLDLQARVHLEEVEAPSAPSRNSNVPAPT